MNNLSVRAKSELVKDQLTYFKKSAQLEASIRDGWVSRQTTDDVYINPATNIDAHVAYLSELKKERETKDQMLREYYVELERLKKEKGTIKPENRDTISEIENRIDLTTLSIRHEKTEMTVLDDLQDKAKSGLLRTYSRKLQTLNPKPKPCKQRNP